MELESTDSQIPIGLYWPRLSLQVSEEPEHTKVVMIRTRTYKYVRRLYESDEFYDLRNDPSELINKINDLDIADELSKMKERLLTFYLETCDVVPYRTDKR